MWISGTLDDVLGRYPISPATTEHIISSVAGFTALDIGEGSDRQRSDSNVLDELFGIDRWNELVVNEEACGHIYVLVTARDLDRDGLCHGIGCEVRGSEGSLEALGWLHH